MLLTFLAARVMSHAVETILSRKAAQAVEVLGHLLVLAHVVIFITATGA
jgi:hypothetical protein